MGNSLISSTKSLPVLALSDRGKLSSAQRRGLIEIAKRLVAEERHQEVRRCLQGHEGVPGPLYWLQNHTETFDEKWKEHGLEPYRRFPRLPYFPWLFAHFLGDRRLFVPKSREMMASWGVIGYAAWLCQFHPRQRVIVQAQKEDKVAELIKGGGNPGYARTLYDRQPRWLQEKYPLTKRMEDMPATIISWANGSTLQGVPKGADQIRQYHPTLLIVDEAAHLDDFEVSYAAADPVCSQIIAVSSAAPGWFGDIVTQALEQSG